MKKQSNRSKEKLTDEELINAIRGCNNHLLKEGLAFALGPNKCKPQRTEFFNRNKEKWKKIILTEGGLK